MSLSAKPPWMRALRAERDLPAWVRGPVECWAFSRLAAVPRGIEWENGGTGEWETLDGESALTVLVLDDAVDMTSLLFLWGDECWLSIAACPPGEVAIGCLRKRALRYPNIVRTYGKEIPEKFEKDF